MDAPPMPLPGIETLPAMGLNGAKRCLRYIHTYIYIYIPAYEIIMNSCLSSCCVFLLYLPIVCLNNTPVLGGGLEEILN